MLCTKLRYNKEEPTPFTKSWRVGKDASKTWAFILQFPNEVGRIVSLKKRIILQRLDAPPIFLDDDLMKIQIDHNEQSMEKNQSCPLQFGTTIEHFGLT